jgi:chemotaxis protein MotA
VDIATLSGIVVGIGMVVGAVFLGPAPGAFVDLPSLLFVLGGTCAAVLLSFPAKELWRAIHTGIEALAAKDIPAREAVTAMVHLAEISCKEGIIALEEIHASNPALKKAARLIARNAPPELIRDTLPMEIFSLQQRRDMNMLIYSRLAACAPAVGMLGTLGACVQMLATLKSPGMLGPGMATALMASFYGFLLSALIFLPVAGKLKARYMQEEQRLNILFEGAGYILENNNPQLVQEQLSSFLSPGERTSAR